MTDLANLVIEKYAELKASHADVRPVRSNTASRLTWPCPSGARFMTLLRNHWDMQQPPDWEKQAIYDEGKDQEKIVLRDLTEKLPIQETQKACEWASYQITGHIDGKLIVDDEAVPIEIKSLSPFSWQKCNTAADFFNGKWPWLRGYPGQLILYMLLENAGRGLLICKNKANAQLKAIEFHLFDWLDYATSLLELAKQVNQHLAAGTEPPVITSDESVCPHCSMLHVCLPGEIGKGAIPIVETEMIEALTRREELQAAHKEFETVDEWVKEQAKKATEEPDAVLACADWLLRIKTRTVNYKAKEASTSVQRIVTISKPKGEQTNGNGTDG